MQREMVSELMVSELHHFFPTQNSFMKLYT
uniref:Uncharacterized protein n=1 Tax=Anguilla anguilla TaxID=7936 RepID=A0A0E9SMD4_ANGAN